MNILHKPFVTADEFEMMSGTEGYELIDGIIQEKKAMGLASSRVQTRITSALARWSDGDRRGIVFDSEAGYICFPHRPRLVRKPDASVVLPGRFPDDQVPTGYSRIRPDLAVEVVSPNDLFHEVEEKLSDYLQVNVPLVWVVNPALRSVHVYDSAGAFRRLTAEDELSGGTVLPGFRIRVADLFPPPVTVPEEAQPEQPTN